MSEELRILLLIAGSVTAVWILHRISKSKVKMEDAIFWFCFAAVLLLFGFFPEFSFGISDLLGFQAPVNCVYVIIIALLVEKLFTVSIKISQLEEKIEILSAEIAIRSKDLEDKLNGEKE